MVSEIQEDPVDIMCTKGLVTTQDLCHCKLMHMRWVEPTNLQLFECTQKYKENQDRGKWRKIDEVARLHAHTYWHVLQSTSHDQVRNCNRC